MKWDENDLDRFLDRTLGELSADPRPGLEQRVVANLAAAQTKPRRWWVWAAVPALAVFIAVAGMAWRLSRSVAPPQPIANTVVPPPSGLVKTPTPMVAQSKWQAHIGPKPAASQVVTARLPRLATFPSQTDEAQARMLLRFVQANPALAQKVVQEEQEFQEMASREYDSSGNPIRNQQEER